jgi:outer membrane usher protein
MARCARTPLRLRVRVVPELHRAVRLAAWAAVVLPFPVLGIPLGDLGGARAHRVLLDESTPSVPELDAPSGATILAPPVPDAPPADDPMAERWTPAFLDASLNGVAVGDTLLVRLDRGDVWVATSDLERAGITGFEGFRRREELTVWVSLRSLAPALVFEVDEKALALRLSASAALLGRRTIDLSSLRRPADLENRSDPALFMNYALQGTDGGESAAFVEAGASADGWRLTSGASRGIDGALTRGMTTAARELRDALVEISAGDVFARGDLLGGSLVLGGLSVRRDFGLDPYLVRQPLPQATAVAMTPSTLELYVNGSLVKRETVAPGVLDLAHIPAVAGRGDARAVLRDAFGRTQEFSSEYYAGAGLLAPGLSDFGYNLGFTRESYSRAGADYRRPALVAHHRAGLTPWATGGVRLDAGLDRVSGGPSVTLALPVGELELAAAASGHARAAGGAGSLAWSWTSRRITSQLVLRAHSARYAHASLGALDDRVLGESIARVGLPVSRRIGFHLDGSLARWRDRGEEQRVNGRVSMSVARGASLQVGAGWANTAFASGLDALVALSWSTGASTSAQLSAERREGESLARASAQRALPRGEGIGYRLEALSGPVDAQGAAELQYQSRVARIDARVDRRGPVQAASATASGAVVWMAGDVFFTRPVQEGFALVEVADVPGVQVTLENQEVGRTGSNGRLLVPGLLPYYGNRLGFRAADVPLDYDFGAMERVVAPPRRGGALVRFDVQKARSLTGTVAVDLDDRVVTPAYGEIRVAIGGGESTSPISGEGRFYIEKLEPGTHQAIVEHARGVCRLALQVPAEAGLVDVGVLRCDQRAAAASGTAPETSPAAAVEAAGPPSASTVTTTIAGPLVVAGTR